MHNIIKVSYSTTRNPLQASRMLQQLANYPTIAADFEVAVRYTKADLEAFRARLLQDPPKAERILLESKLAATALGHPSHCTLTHFSVAWSESDAYVFILDNKAITNLVLNFLVTTPQRQVWHNLGYDGRFIQHFTGKFPQLYEDTQILAKTLLNHTNPMQAQTGLKHLAGHVYGSWGISEDNFSLSTMYDEHLLQYAATDSCATFWLWNYLNNQCDKIDSEYGISWEPPY